MEHVTRAPTRYAWNALWLMDHVVGREATDRVLPGVRGRVERRIGEQLAVCTGRTVALERRADLDRDTFLREYVATDTPVVLAGAARDWRATRTWDFPFFIREHGELPVQLMNAALGEEARERGGELRPLGGILEDALAGSPVYPRFVPLLITNPELLDDLDRDWLFSLRGPTGAGLGLQLFIGGPGTSTALHCAIGSNLFVQVHGRKRWHLASTAWSAALRVELERSPYFFSHLDLEHPDPERFPWARHATVWTTELDAGDVMYVPPFFWHQVRNPTRSIGVGFRWYDPLAMLRSSATLTALTLMASNPDIVTAARLKGDFSKIFAGRWRS
jgi:hypothetical protein